MDKEFKYTSKISENEILLFLQKNNYNFFPPLNEQVDITKYAKKLSNFADFVIVKNQNEIVALCAYYNNSPKAYLTSIVVDKKYKGRGIGNSLIDKMILKIRNKPISLEVYKNNEIAIELYKKKGFRIQFYKGEFAYMKRKPQIKSKLK